MVTIVEEFFFERIAILIHDGELAEKEAIDKAYLMTWKMFPNKPMPEAVLAVVKQNGRNECKKSNGM